MVATRCSFATPPAAYAKPLWCCDAASRLHNGGEVAQFLHKTSYAICDASLLSHTANSRPSGRIRSFMQKSGSRISPDTPRAATRGSVRSLRGLLCRVAARVPQLTLRHTRARAASRLRKTHTGVVCDCSSLSPLTLKPLRSPTPRPFAAIATALLSGLRRTRGSAANGHGFGGFVSWLAASPAFHNVGGVLHQLRYVQCAASLKAATRCVVPLRGYSLLQQNNVGSTLSCCLHGYLYAVIADAKFHIMSDRLSSQIYKCSLHRIQIFRKLCQHHYVKFV